jgi:hypothetical protein
MTISFRRRTWISILLLVTPALSAIPAPWRFATAYLRTQLQALAVTEVTQLPSASPPIGPLHRSDDGQIEITTPENRPNSSPACSPSAICVGSKQRLRSLRDALALARDGDVVEVEAGTYRESDAIAQKGLTVRGVGGRPHFQCAGLKLPGSRACLFLGAAGITLENIEISGAEDPTSAGGDAACIRNARGANFTLRGVICHGSQEGVASNGGAIVIEGSEFFDNGWSDAAHNGYFAGDCTLTIRGSIFREARVGTEFTSRCAKTVISDSTFRNTKGTTAIEVPAGGDTMIYRSTIVKTPGARRAEILSFATECRYPGSMVLKDVRIINSRTDAEIQNHGACVGHAIAFERVSIEGLAPKLLGDIRRE